MVPILDQNAARRLNPDVSLQGRKFAFGARRLMNAQKKLNQVEWERRQKRTTWKGSKGSRRWTHAHTRANGNYYHTQQVNFYIKLGRRTKHGQNSNIVCVDPKNTSWLALPISRLTLGWEPASEPLALMTYSCEWLLPRVESTRCVSRGGERRWCAARYHTSATLIVEFAGRWLARAGGRSRRVKECERERESWRVCWYIAAAARIKRRRCASALVTYICCTFASFRRCSSSVWCRFSFDHPPAYKSSAHVSEMQRVEK